MKGEILYYNLSSNAGGTLHSIAHFLAYLFATLHENKLQGPSSSPNARTKKGHDKSFLRLQWIDTRTMKRKNEYNQATYTNTKPGVTRQHHT